MNTSYSYDGLSHLLSVLHQAGLNTLDGAGYTYDSAGNRLSKTNYLNGVTSNYSYDSIYELTQVTQGASTTETYSYDAVGNRPSSLSVPDYNYNVSNELTSNSNGSYTYDANGNTLSDAQGRSLTWDFENRLTQVINPGVGTTTFRYDPFGRRIQKSGPLGTTNYLYDGSNALEEVDNSGNVTVRYTQSPGNDEPLSEVRAGTTSYYQQEDVGSVTSLSGSAGALANTYTYDSFGNLTASTGSITNPFQFAGREFDPETETYDNRFRYYDQRAGRFISEDPMGFLGGINKYAYVFNDPTRFNDPFGLQGGCPEYPTDCVHNQSERDQIARENYEWHERIFGPPPAPGPPPPSDCKCKKAEVKELTMERQLEAWSLAWRILDAVEEVGVGTSMIGGGVGGGAYVCVQTGFAGCVLAIEAAPGLVVGGYLVTRSAVDDLEEIFINDEDCK